MEGRGTTDRQDLAARAMIVLQRSPARDRTSPWQAVLKGGVAAAAVLGFTFVVLERYTERAPVFGATSALGGVLIVLVGWLLRRRGSARSGALLVGTGLCWLATWLVSYDSGVLPLVSAMANALMYLFLGWGLLLHPSIGPIDRFGRLWLKTAAISLIGGQLALTLTSIPGWAGYSADIVWPHVIADKHVYDAVSLVAIGGYIIVGIGFAALMLRAARRMPDYERTLLAPALVAGSLVAPLAIILFLPNLSEPTLTVVEDVFGRQGLAILLVAVGLASVELRRGVIAARAIHFMLLRAETPTPAIVGDGLRRVLNDRGLEIDFWLPSVGAYFDVHGVEQDRAHASSHGAGDGSTEAAESDDQVPLARLVGALWLTHHLDLVRLTGRVAGSAIHAAAAQLELTRERDELERAQARASDADNIARERLAEQLHDGALQVLSVVAFELGEIRRQVSDHDSRRALGEAHGHLREGIEAARSTMYDLRENDLAEGLAVALHRRARESSIPATVSVPDAVEMSPATERALYGALRECLANANRHSSATHVEISVALENGHITGVVEDDGIGGACIGTRGGLASKADCVAALGGRMTITSAHERGTRAEVTLDARSDR